MHKRNTVHYLCGHVTAWGMIITGKNVCPILCNCNIMTNIIYNHDFANYVILQNQNHISFYHIYNAKNAIKEINSFVNAYS